MDFQILGPLEVRSERGAVGLGGAKPRAVLAVLLLHANESVSAERLAVALWGEDAPAGAVKTVQVHVSRLRKALGDPEAVITTPAGYRLQVRPGELDAERFAHDVAQGRRALEAGDAERAGAVLREALELWRGPALADLAFEPFAPAEIARLEEQRLVALEARVEADLARGVGCCAGERAAAAARRASDARAAWGCVDARALSRRTSGRGARGLPRRPPHARRGGRHRARHRAAAPARGDPAPRPLARPAGHADAHLRAAARPAGVSESDDRSRG